MKVLDFGIAKLANETGHTRTGTLLGTPYYMSPEQWHSDKNIDGRADVYSLGIILYECVTGALPFSGSSALQIMYAHLQKPMPDPGAQTPLPEGLRALVLRMASKTPSERPASMHEVEAALRALSSGSDGGRGSSGALSLDTLRTRDVLQRLRTRGPWLLAGLGGVSLALLLLSFLFKKAPPGGRTKAAPPADLLPPAPVVAAPVLPPELVVLGPARFPIGTGAASAEDGPAHTVDIPRFALSRVEVSFSALAEYEAATGRRLPALQGINLTRFGTRPAVNLSRDEAAAYCRWRYATWGGRLPTEEEWEFAARSGDPARLFPWAGERIGPALANLGGTQARTFPVESFEDGASSQGILHLVGNAAEWTSSDAAPYPGSSARITRGLAVVRGGGANQPATRVRATTRWFVPPASGNPFLGFRCAATPAP